MKATTVEEWKKKKERTKVTKVFMMNKEVLFTINLFKDL